jgi:hypothetical protein
MGYNELMTKKNILLIIVLLILVGVGVYFYIQPSEKTERTEENTAQQQSFDAKNATFEVEGRTVTLVNGVSEVEAAPGSAAKITVRYFGNNAEGDLNGDGTPDTAFLITQDGGGSGLFYYAIVALQIQSGYQMTNAVFIGDRIAPQSTDIDKNTGELHVNYAERKLGEPITTDPSVGVTKTLKITPQGILDIVQ